MNRTAKLLQGIDLAAGDGLEFGPLNRPMLRRPAARVTYVDHLDTAGLRAKYAADPHVAVADIVETGLVWGSGPLRAAVDAATPGRWFQYAVASHVIEHVPDMIWWLAELRSVMSSGGALRLVVPDRRFTMDIARRESTVADAIAANLCQARRPQVRDVLDFYLQFHRVDVVSAWLGRQAVRDMFTLEQATRGMRLARSALDGAYEDVHCWVFTPRSFVLLMVGLARLGMIWFAFERLHETAENQLDFFVHMRAADDAEDVQESWRRALREVSAGDTLPQEEPEGLRAQIARQAARIEALERELAAGGLLARLTGKRRLGG